MHKDANIDFSQIVFNVRPQTDEKHRTRITIGGNVLEHDGKTKSPTSNIITMKLLLRRVLNMPDEKFMAIDVKTTI